jgi:hypothetical protein
MSQRPAEIIHEGIGDGIRPTRDYHATGLGFVACWDGDERL